MTTRFIFFLLVSYQLWTSVTCKTGGEEGERIIVGRLEESYADSLFTPVGLAPGESMEERTQSLLRYRSRRQRSEIDPDTVAMSFVEHYYSTFDANRAGLANLFQDGSMLTFEGHKIQGSQNIVDKLTSLPFQQCKNSIHTVDCQPSGAAGGMLVFVTGNLQLAGEQNWLKFSQIFHLIPTPEGSYYALNDMFRLNYG